MNSEKLILLDNLCAHYNIEMAFFYNLSQMNRITIKTINKSLYVEENTLHEIEKMIRMHQELNVNTEGIDIVAKVRSTTPGIQAKINFITNDKIEVNILGTERAITPGQACVLYDNTRVLGGGWITRDIQ